MNATHDDRFSLLDMDDTRKPAPANPADASGAPALDLIDDVKAPRCVDCSERRPVNDDGVCQLCFGKRAHDAVAARAHDVVASRTPDSFADIVENAATNAAAQMLGDMARGRASLGVGYTSAEGYIEALRRGAARQTVEEYARTLRGTYKRKVDVSFSGNRYTISIDEGKSTHTTFDAALLTLQSGDGSSGADSHANDEGIAKLKRESAARKAAAAALKAKQKSEQTMTSAPVVEDVQPVKLVHGQLVAGAAADGHGVLIGWTGSGDMTRAEMLARLDGAKLPREWAFDAKDPAVQLTRAVRTVAGGRYNVEQEKKKDAQVVETREWSSRWMLVTRSLDGGAKVGEKYGDIALVVTLYTDKPEPELVFDNGADVGLVEAVRQEFAARIGAERYVASDITRWLAMTLKTRCHAVRYGGNWYVPRAHRVTAESLVAAFKTWGADWMDPPLPIATTTQLAQGLANGLMREVDEELRKLEAQRENAREKTQDPKVDVGERAASSFMLRLRQIGERVCAYEKLLGVEMMTTCQNKIRTAMGELSALIEGAGTVERFAAVWDEIEFDIARAEGKL